MSISALHLGATLYTPAIIPVLKAKTLISGDAYPELKSLVICLEDSLTESQVEPGLVNLKQILSTMREEAFKRNILLFIRPRNIEMAKQILGWGFNECFDGFVAPKFHLGESWLEIMPSGLYLMPTCEHKDYFDASYRAELRDWLNPNKEKILCLRIGGNDLLSSIGLRRPRTLSIYDTPVGGLIRNMACEFGSHGYEMNSPVFEHFAEVDLLEQEVKLDLAHGLYTKTAIHPCQIDLIQSMYKVSPIDLEDAETILSKNSVDAGGVYNSGSGSMLEPATHYNWAKKIIERSKVYGVKKKLSAYSFG